MFVTRNAEQRDVKASVLHTAAFEHSFDMLATIDMRTQRIVNCNELLAKTLGHRDKQELIGKQFSVLYHGAGAHQLDGMWRQIEREGCIENKFTMLQTNGVAHFCALYNANACDQNLLHCSWTDIIKLTNSGAVMNSSGVNEDIRPQVTLSLAERQESLLSHMMSELHQDGWWKWDATQADSVFLSGGLNGLLSSKHSDERRALRSLARLLHKEDVAQVFHALREHFQRGTAFNIQHRLRCEDGSYKWFICRGSLISDTSYSPKRMLGTFQEISQLVEAQAELKSRFSELALFGYRASHDLKGPLTTITRLSQQALSNVKAKDKISAESKVHSIGKLSGDLSKLAASIMDLSKNDLEDKPDEEINIREIFCTIDKQLALFASQHGVEISYSVIPEYPIYGQQTRLQSIFYKIVHNSIKFSDSGKPVSRVDICVKSTDDGCQITVSDNGIGIPEHYHRLVFDKFQQFHPELSEGCGLGLSIVKDQLDRMRASISFTSGPSGTCFEIILPQSPPSMAD